MMVYAYVHGIKQFRENELSIQKVFSSVFVWNTVFRGDFLAVRQQTAVFFGDTQTNKYIDGLKRLTLPCA